MASTQSSGGAAHVPPRGPDRRELGRRGEDEAARYLQLQGLTIVERNWRCRDGEIDIVALDDIGDCLVIVEVKTRRTAYFGRPVEAVNPAKARRLRVLAARWLADHPVATSQVRIDIIGVLAPPDAPLSIEHLRDVS